MKAEIGFDVETKQHYMLVRPESSTEWTMLRWVSPLLGLRMSDYDDGAKLLQQQPEATK